MQLPISLDSFSLSFDQLYQLEVVRYANRKSRDDRIHDRKWQKLLLLGLVVIMLALFAWLRTLAGYGANQRKLWMDPQKRGHHLTAPRRYVDLDSMSTAYCTNVRQPSTKLGNFIWYQDDMPTKLGGLRKCVYWSHGQMHLSSFNFNIEASVNTTIWNFQVSESGNSIIHLHASFRPTTKLQY